MLYSEVQACPSQSNAPRPQTGRNKHTMKPKYRNFLYRAEAWSQRRKQRAYHPVLLLKAGGLTTCATSPKLLYWKQGFCFADTSPVNDINSLLLSLLGWKEAPSPEQTTLRATARGQSAWLPPLPPGQVPVSVTVKWRKDLLISQGCCEGQMSELVQNGQLLTVCFIS